MRGKRLDIQGLRAIAVFLVIGNHLVDWPAGGFVGVDIFFVISGFLITGLLLRELSAHGKISLRDFYVRRAKRILPAAVTVTLVTVGLSFLLFSLPRAQVVLTDGLFASALVANWRFIATGTDYMHATDSLSPFQHYWSLSVEEQFYLIWPILMVLLYVLTSRRTTQAITALLVLLTGASFVWAMWESAVQPTWAYFSTASRAWELGLGGVLACATPALARIPVRLRPVLAWGGLAVIAVSAATLTSSTVFPAPWALLPVLGTALVIAAGTGGQPRFVYPLTNRVMAYAGELSYSLYLWHLPVIVFVATLLPQRGEKYQVLSAALILVLAILSYHWIENPLRKANWGLKRHFRRLRTGWNAPRLKRFALPVLLVSVVALGLVTYNSRLPMVAAQSAPIGALLSDETPTEAQSLRAQLIVDALAENSWPELTPAIRDLGPAAKASEWVTDGCLALESFRPVSPEENALECVYGDPDADRTIVVVGDSTAISYVPAIREAVGDSWRIQVNTMSQCPAIDVSVALADPAAGAQCSEFRQWAFDQVTSISPDLVVLTSSPPAIRSLASKNPNPEGEWRAGVVQTFDALTSTRVVVLDPPPMMYSLIDCAIVGSTPADCVSTPTADFISVGTITRAVAKDYPNVTVPSTIGWYCDVTGRCPEFIGETPTLADGTHLSEMASEKLAPLIKEALDL